MAERSFVSTHGPDLGNANVGICIWPSQHPVGMLFLMPFPAKRFWFREHVYSLNTILRKGVFR